MSELAGRNERGGGLLAGGATEDASSQPDAAYRIYDERVRKGPYREIRVVADLSGLHLLPIQRRQVVIYRARYITERTRAEKMKEVEKVMTPERLEALKREALAEKRRLIQRSIMGREVRKRVSEMVRQGQFEEAMNLESRALRRVLAAYGLRVKNAIVIDACDRFRAVLLSVGTTDPSAGWMHDRFRLVGIDDTGQPWELPVPHWGEDYEKYDDVTVEEAMARIFGLDAEAVKNAYALQGDVIVLRTTDTSVPGEEVEATSLGRHEVVGRHVRSMPPMKIWAKDECVLRHPQHAPVTLAAGAVYMLVMHTYHD